MTLLRPSLFAALVLSSTAPALAQVDIDQNLSSLPAGPNFEAVDLSTGNLPAGAILPYNGAPFTIGSGSGAETISFVGISNGEGIVNGSAGGEYAAPVTGSGGTVYGGNYFSTGQTTPTTYIDVAFASPEKALALLWGSVDLSNEITFLSNGIVVGTVLGSQIESNASGFQGYGGSFYTLLNLTGGLTFNEIRLGSGVVSFEGAEFEASQTNDFIPEPASLGLLGTAAAGLPLLRRRRSRA